MFLKSLDEQHVGGAASFRQGQELGLVLLNTILEFVASVVEVLEHALVVEVFWAEVWQFLSFECRSLHDI